jgi:hypothetical protein
VTSISFYCGNPTGNTKVGLYSDTGSNYPKVLLIGPVEKTSCSVNSWNTLPVTPTYLTAGTYWLAEVDSGNGAGTNSGTAGTITYQPLSYGNAWPSTAPAGLSSISNNVQEYATYDQVGVSTTTTTKSSSTTTTTQTSSSTTTTISSTTKTTSSSSSTTTSTSTTSTTTASSSSSSSSTATFGKTSTANNWDSANYIFWTKVTLPTAGRVTSISFYCGGGATGNTKVGLYSDNGGNNPNALLIGPVEKTSCSAFSWNTVSVTPTLLSAGTYWLAEDDNGNGAGTNSGTAGTLKYEVLSYGNAWPTAAPAALNSASNNIQEYATYDQVGVTTTTTAHSTTTGSTTTGTSLMATSFTAVAKAVLELVPVNYPSSVGH